jgi:hypothetical protein
MRRKPDAHSLVILAGLAATMAGCSSHDDGQWRVCADAQGRRLPDIACQQNSGYAHGGSGWIFISRSYAAPPVGQVITGGTRSGTGPAYSAPAQGIARGGFGSTGEGGAGHGAGE